jgi:hypothetical protein
MGLQKIDVGITERIAPNKGPTSSADYNASMEEIINSLAQLSIAWNTQLQPLIDTLPGGSTGVDRDTRTQNPNPFLNGFDGSQLFTDLTSTPISDSGRFYDLISRRPLTLKETFNKIQDQLNQSIQNLDVKIAQVNKNNGLTPRQKQAIGSRIFDPGTDSSLSSIDGIIGIQSRYIDQIALDISGSTNYLIGNGTQSLVYSLVEQLKAMQEAHNYDSNFNKMDHGHLKFHEHRYHVAPIGAINGINRDYFLPSGEEFVAGSLRVMVNGIELKKSKYYTEHPNNKGFSITSIRDPLEADLNGSDDMLWIHYEIETTGEF